MEFSDMELLIELIGENAPFHARDLRNWFEREGIPGVAVNTETPPSNSDKMGFDLLAVLAVTLNAKAISEMGRSMQTWFKTRKPKIDIKIKTKGKEFHFKGENVLLDEAFVENMKGLLKEVG
jgi:hypothetical protein